MPKKATKKASGWKIAGVCAGIIALLGVAGFAGYGIYSLAENVKENNQQQEEVQTPEDNEEQTTPTDEEQIGTEALAQFGIR